MSTAAPAYTQRVRFIENRGQRILFIDFSGLQATADILREIEAARRIIRAQPPDSVRIMSNVHGTR